jgi:hypothetical protein
MNRHNDFLVEVSKDLYHVFPGIHEVTQEESMFLLGDKSAGLALKKIPQKDGSRFAVIQGRFKTPGEIVIRIAAAHSHRRPIWIGRRPSAEELLDMISSGTISPQNSTFIAYKTHQFLNGARYFLVIARDTLNCFLDVGALFPENVPEDSLGLFAENLSELGIKKVDGWTWVPHVVEYLSEIRLCSKCGVVSNFSVPKHTPWGSYQALTQKIRDRILSGTVEIQEKSKSKAGRKKNHIKDPV